MQVQNSPERYGAIPKTFHWATVVLVIAGWLLGQFGDDLPHTMHAAGLAIHIAIGMTIFVLLVARLVWRFIDPPPPPESTALGGIAKLAARSIHGALYALLVPMSIMRI